MEHDDVHKLLNEKGLLKLHMVDYSDPYDKKRLLKQLFAFMEAHPIELPESQIRQASEDDDDQDFNNLRIITGQEPE